MRCFDPVEDTTVVGGDIMLIMCCYNNNLTVATRCMSV